MIFNKTNSLVKISYLKTILLLLFFYNSRNKIIYFSQLKNV